jgi:hypothetical protein
MEPESKKFTLADKAAFMKCFSVERMASGAEEGDRYRKELLALAEEKKLRGEEESEHSEHSEHDSDDWEGTILHCTVEEMEISEVPDAVKAAFVEVPDGGLKNPPSCTEKMITVAPPWCKETFQRPALVPGEKTVVTTFRIGEEGVLDGEFELGKTKMRNLLLYLGEEKESFLKDV